MIGIAIVEDEDIYADQLQDYIRQYGESHGEQFKVTRFTDGDEITENYQGGFDIILMDIQMQFMDGMTAAETIRKQDSEVIIMFITNRIDYALRGYQVDALDYVLKPITYFSFEEKLARAIGRVQRQEKHPIVINSGSGITKVYAEDIYFIESEGHNLNYTTASGVYQERKKIKDAEEELAGQGFFCINKGSLVNLRHVDSVKDGCANIAGEALPISRARKNEFMEALLAVMEEA